jgi:DNA-binding beta-propeller fold protein YncE
MRIVQIGALAACGVLLCRAAHAQPTVPSGFTIEALAPGLDGPEGVALIGGGHVAVVEAIDSVTAPPFVATRRLMLVQKNGKRRVLAQETGIVTWVGVVRDEERGFFVTTLGGLPRGIRLIGNNGDVATFFATTVQYTGIALDAYTGDLYVAHVAPGPASIDRIDRNGVSSVFAPNLRPEGLLVTDDRRLVATIQRQPAFGPPTTVNAVAIYDLVSGGVVIAAANVGTQIGSVAVGKSGDIFVSDYRDGVIRRLTPNGIGGYTVSMFASGFSTQSQRFPNAPPQFGLSFNELAFDPSGEHLYVSDYGSGRLYRISGRF